MVFITYMRLNSKDNVNLGNFGFHKKFTVINQWLIGQKSHTIKIKIIFLKMFVRFPILKSSYDPNLEWLNHFYI